MYIFIFKTHLGESIICNCNVLNDTLCLFICRNEINIIDLLFTFHHSLTIYWEPICAKLGLHRWVRQRPVASPVDHAWPFSPPPIKTNKCSLRKHEKHKEMERRKNSPYPHFPKTTIWHFSVSFQTPFEVLYFVYVCACECLCVCVDMQKTEEMLWQKFINFYHMKHYIHTYTHRAILQHPSHMPLRMYELKVLSLD